MKKQETFLKSVYRKYLNWLLGCVIDFALTGNIRVNSIIHMPISMKLKTESPEKSTNKILDNTKLNDL